MLDYGFSLERRMSFKPWTLCEINMIIREYKATCGYHDYPPGVDELHLKQKIRNGIVTLDFEPLGNFFNEVQVGGDASLRREKLTGGESEILFMDDPDYDKLALRKLHWVTRNLPLELSDEFVKSWALMSSYPIDLIMNPHKIDYIGDVDRRIIIPHIANLDDNVKSELLSKRDETTFVNAFVEWRKTLDQEFEYHE